MGKSKVYLEGISFPKSLNAKECIGLLQHLSRVGIGGKETPTVCYDYSLARSHILRGGRYDNPTSRVEIGGTIISPRGSVNLPFDFRHGPCENKNFFEYLLLGQINPELHSDFSLSEPRAFASEVAEVVMDYVDMVVDVARIQARASLLLKKCGYVISSLG